MLPVTWTEERTALLKRLWDEGLSASKVAAAIGGVTRNAVIGKVSRLGLARHDRVTSRVAGPSKPRARIQNRGTAGFVIRGPKVDPEPFIPLAEIEIPEAQRKTLAQLTDWTCRWPVGDPQTEDFYFCGGEVGPGKCKPYCKTHARIAYNRPAVRSYKLTPAEHERERRRAYKAAMVAEAVAA